MLKSSEEKLAAQRKYMAAWRSANLEKMAAYREKWATANPEKNAQVKKEWKKRNPDKERELTRKWQRNNRKKAAACSAAWRERNPDAVAAQRKAYYAEHQESLRALRKLTYLANPEKARATSREWRKRNPEKVRQSSLQRKALIAGSEGRVTAAEILNLWDRQGGKCAYFSVCGNVLKDGIRGAHRDHIEPLRPRDPSRTPGKHVIENIQLLCGDCNNKKSAKDPYLFTQQHEGRLFPDLPQKRQKL